MSSSPLHTPVHHRVETVFTIAGIRILVVILVSKGWNASDVSSIVGVFISIVGTLVGAFLGVQVGAAGKDKAQNLANRALAALPPETAKAILDR